MSNQFQPDTDSQKNSMINFLLDLGVYKKGTKHLYELSLTELEKEYLTIKQQTWDYLKGYRRSLK
ncbi:Fur-regulated basic protein FbpA [Priestia megaterium]